MSWNLIILFIVGSFAGFNNVFAGGGSTLTLPALIFAGLDSATANGTNRIAILVQNLFATASFHKQKVSGMNIAFKYGLYTLPGAIAGAFFSVKIPDIWFHRILGVVMIAILFTLFQKKDYSQQTCNEQHTPGIRFYIYLLAMGFYGGFIQVGIGFLFIGGLYHFLQTSLLRVNVYKIIIILMYTLPALAIFVFSGKVDWLLGLALSAGNALGGWIGAHMQVTHGDKLIRNIMLIAISLMAIKLIFF